MDYFKFAADTMKAVADELKLCSNCGHPEDAHCKYRPFGPSPTSDIEEGCLHRDEEEGPRLESGVRQYRSEKCKCPGWEDDDE